MNIGVDISQIIYEGTGVARFTTGLTLALCRIKDTHHFTFWYSSLRKHPHPSVLSAINQAGHSLQHLRLPSSITTPLWNNLRAIPITTFVKPIDWFITSDWTEPPAACKKATIIHDFVFKRYPETVDPYVLSVMKNKLELVAKESDVIFTDSHATADDAQSYYNISPQRLHINYPGVEIGSMSDSSIVKEKYNITKPFFITVGKREPRKNLDRLFAAYKSLGSTETELLVVGPEGWGNSPQPLSGIRFLGFIPDADLWSLYNLSQGLVFPSLWEGFGYPAVEALLSGSRIAVSNRSSLKEISDGKAVEFNPENVEEIAHALKILQSNTSPSLTADERTALANKYSWDRYAQKLIETLEAHV